MSAEHSQTQGKSPITEVKEIIFIANSGCKPTSMIGHIVLCYPGDYYGHNGNK